MRPCDWGSCEQPARGWRLWHRPPGWPPLWLPVCTGHGPAVLELAA